MTVFSRLFVTRGVKFSSQGRVEKSLRCGPTRSSIHKPSHVHTLRSTSREVAETVSRKGIDLCCLEEVRWCGVSAHMIVGKDSRYKIFWIGSDNGNQGVCILHPGEWIEKVYDISRISDHLIMIKVAIGNHVVTVLSCYSPQVGLDNTVKNAFYDLLHSTVNRVSGGET